MAAPPRGELIPVSPCPDWSQFIIDQLTRFMASKIGDLDQRYGDLRTADDLRYQQRFDAQQKALEQAALAADRGVSAAFAAADKAVTAAMSAADKAVQAASVAAEKSVAAALASSEKAIEKAEAAQAAHNVSQNEWRQTVNDLTKTVAETARHEAEALVSSLRQTTDIAREAYAKELASLTARIGNIEGVAHGALANRSERRAEVSSMAVVVGVCCAVVGAVIGVLTYSAVHQSAPLAPVVATAPLNTLRAP
jgi:hypothetical protein